MTNTKRKRRIMALQTKLVADAEEKRIMPILPDDIILKILLMLPGKSICRIRCVCKYWCHKLLKDPNFIRSRDIHSFETEKLNCFSIKERNVHEFYKHITSSSLLSEFEDDNYECVKMDSPFKSPVVDDTGLETIDILSSCNGLILMMINRKVFYGDNSLCLWNPYTKEFNEIVIPEIKYVPAQLKGIGRSGLTYGLGHNGDTDDYRIVEATFYGSNYAGDYHGCQVQVYTSSSHSWKTLANIFPYQINGFRSKGEVIFVCGAFHWIATNLENKETCILAFDIHDENFREVPLTQQVYELFGNKNYSYIKPLGVLQGCLCMILASDHGSNIEVWMMKDYKVRESWTKLFIAVFTNSIYNVKILWEFKNGDVLFVTTTGYGSDTCLVIYDPVSKRTKVKKIQHIPEDEWNMVAYVESLVSLSSIGWSRKRPRTCTQGSRKSVRLADKAQLIGRKSYRPRAFGEER